MGIQHSSKDNEKGLYLILIAFFLFVLVALCALVVGLGFLSTNKSRLQNIANSSSIAALDSFILARDSNGNVLPYQTRQNMAISRANELLTANGRLPGMGMAFGDVGLPPNGGNGGSLTLGIWYSERPLSAPYPCGTLVEDYPCFIANPVGNSTPFANAIKLDVKSQPNNPLYAPLISIFGARSLGLETSAIARVVQRCVAFLMDVSMSTVQETHVSTTYKEPAFGGCVGASCAPCFPSGWHGMAGNCGPAEQRTLAPTPALVIVTPYPAALFAYRASGLGAMASFTPPPNPTPHPCQNLNNYTSDEFYYYCNMPINRSVGAMATPYTLHYRSDYRPHASPWGTVYIDSLFERLDTFYGPQPLSRFYLAFNAGLRAVNQIRSPGDKAILYVFTGQSVGTEPVGTPPYGLTESLDTLIQLTNMNNRGTLHTSASNEAPFPVITPSFVSRGFFPILAESSDAIASNSNHAQALWDAIGALSNCPDSARRSIIIATDGIPSCAWNRQGNLNGTPRPVPTIDCPPPVGGDYYSNYLAAEAAILGPIKDELIKKGISVTALLDSEAIEPNYVNATIPAIAPTPPGVYVSPEDAPALGFCGVSPTVAGGGNSACMPFFNTTPYIPLQTEQTYNDWKTQCGNDPGCNEDHFAFMAKDGPQFGVKFRRPNALWGQLAFDTGGVICPLLPNCPAAWYASATPPALLPAARAAMPLMNCAPIKTYKSQQAINCVLAAIGVNPYQNVEELRTPTAAPN